jgi:hypothetical protein
MKLTGFVSVPSRTTLSYKFTPDRKLQLFSRKASTEQLMQLSCT